MIDRFSLQGFDLSEKKAAVIGCGGLGCHIATHLACAGIGTLLLCDGDTVSESNLNRQFLYTAKDLGKEKAALAKARLLSTAPDTRITAVSRTIKTAEDLSFVENADIVFLAVDNNAARLQVQAFCKQKKRPLVNGGVNGFFGTAYLYLPGETPDLLSVGMLDAENQKTLSVSSTVGVIGALEAHLGIRYLTGDTSGAGKLFVFDNGRISVLPIKSPEN